MGRGWRSNFDVTLTLTPTGTNPPWYAFAVLPDGREIHFEKTTGTTYRTRGFNPVSKTWAVTPNVTETLVKGTSDWRLTATDDTVYVFNSTGRLSSTEYRGGYVQTLTWDTNGVNTQVSDNLGRSITFTYGTNGLLSELTDPDGNKVKYTYLDKSNMASVPNLGGLSVTNVVHIEYALEKVIHPDSTPSTDADNPAVQYHYENTGLKFALTGITDERGIRYATWSYNTDGRVASSEHAGPVEDFTFSYDDTNSKNTVTNALGKQTVFHFNKNIPGVSLLTKIEGKVSTNCAAADTTLTYDSNRFLQDLTDGEGRVTRHVHNTRGLPTSITRAYGTGAATSTTYTWHSTLNVPTQIVQPGLTTDLTWTSGQLTGVTQTDTTSHSTPYSTNGQTRTWAYTYTTTGGLLASVNGPLSGTGDTVSYTYNSSGFIETVTNEVGHVTTFTAWNGRGQPTAMTDPNNVDWALAYNERGWLTTITVDPAGLTAATSIDYDSAGQITKITRPNGAFLEYTWDNARRLTKIEDNSGDYIEYDYNDLSNPTARRAKTSGGTLKLTQTATFDELGRLLTFVGAATQTWTAAYDRTDNRVSVTDPRSNVYQWAFDGLNRLYRETNEDSEQVTLTLNGKDEVTNYRDPRTLDTGYVRNGFGDAIQRTSPDTGTTVYEFNALGKVTKVTDARSVVTDLTYDNAGRILTKEFPAATAEDITYTWDSTASGNKGVGRLTKVDDASGSVEWVYDVLGRVTQEKKTTASIAYTIDYQSDLAGNVTQMTYPSGRIVTFSRDSVGRISGVTTKKDSGSSTVTLASSVAYEPFGPLKSLTYGNSLLLTKTFTQDYLIDDLKVEDTGTSTTVVDRSHAFGDDVNLTGITDNITSARNETYAYTDANRLNNAAGIWGTLAWTYDSVGNRSSEALTSGSTTTWTYAYPSTNNKLSTVTEGSNVRTFTHDSAGNVTADDRVGTTYNYRYNNRARLDRLTVGSTVKADYVYDGLERLAIRETQNMTPSGVTHYLYDRSGRLIAEATDTGQTVREYVWLDDMPIAVVADVDTASPQLWFVHADHLDRPIKMTNSSQATVWDAVYRPFGEIVSISGSASNNLRFPGQYFLIESGLHYNWHRQYDPTIGRYLQADPLGFVDGPSVYAYARSRPTMLVDRDGRVVFYGFGTGAAVGGIGPTFTLGTGYDTSSKTFNSFVSPGVGVGIDWGAGGGFGVVFGNWCDLHGRGVNLNVSLLGFGFQLSISTSGVIGIAAGYIRGPSILPAGLSVSYTNTVVGYGPNLQTP